MSSSKSSGHDFWWSHDFRYNSYSCPQQPRSPRLYLRTVRTAELILSVTALPITFPDAVADYEAKHLIISGAPNKPVEKWLRAWASLISRVIVPSRTCVLGIIQSLMPNIGQRITCAAIKRVQILCEGKKTKDQNCVGAIPGSLCSQSH